MPNLSLFDVLQRPETLYFARFAIYKRNIFERFGVIKTR